MSDLKKLIGEKIRSIRNKKSDLTSIKPNNRATNLIFNRS